MLKFETKRKANFQVWVQQEKVKIIKRIKKLSLFYSKPNKPMKKH
jgi:hypothetical protein